MTSGDRGPSRGFGPGSSGGGGGVRGRKVDQHRIQAPLLSLERQILLEEEGTIPPRGAVRLPRLTCRQEGRDPCLRFFQRSVHDLVVQADRRMLDHR